MRFRHLLDYGRFLSGEGLYPWRNMSVVSEADPNMLGVWKYVAGSECWVFTGCVDWWAHQDSNLGPSDYESDALTN